MTAKSNMADLLDNEQDTSKDLPPEAPVILPEAPVVLLAEPKQKVVDKRRKSDREQLVASIGISRDYLPPITRKRAAIYQLCNMKGKLDRRLEGTDQFVDPQPYDLTPHYTFLDMREQDLARREKTLTYYEGGTEVVYVEDAITKTRTPHSRPKIGSPGFVNGQVVVNITGAYARYVWWELHPRNASNKFRDKTKEPLFERVDILYQSAHVQNIMADLMMEAESYVLSLKPDKLINLASAMTNPTVATSVDVQELKFNMRQRARSNPREVLFTSPDNSASIKLACIQALDLGIITFVPEKEAYYYGDESTPFHLVPHGNNPFDTLIIMLDKPEFREELDQIKQDLSFWF